MADQPRAEDMSCDLHRTVASVGTVAGKRGVRRPVCVECRDNALVLGLDRTFRSYDDERNAVALSTAARWEQIQERAREAAKEARRG